VEVVTVPWLTAGVADVAGDGELAADGEDPAGEAGGFGEDTAGEAAEFDGPDALGGTGAVARAELEVEGASPRPLRPDGPPCADGGLPVLVAALWVVPALAPAADDGPCSGPPMTTTAMAPAAMTDVAAPATTAFEWCTGASGCCIARCQADAPGALSGLGKPEGPKRPARSAALNRAAIPAGVGSAMVLSS
jgi:hypothetical protein